MTFLYAVMFDSEKEETAENEKIPLTNTDKDMLMMQAAKVAMAAEMEKYKEEVEREKAKLNADLNKKHEELSIIAELVVES